MRTPRLDRGTPCCRATAQAVRDQQEDADTRQSSTLEDIASVIGAPRDCLLQDYRFFNLLDQDL